MKYECIEEFYLPFLDEHGSMTDDYGKVSKGSIWEYDPSYVSESDVRMCKENGDDDFGFIDITNEHFDKYFRRIA